MNRTRHSSRVTFATFSPSLGIPARAAPKRLTLWGAAIAALVVLAANKPVLGFDWLLFDDDINVFFNPHLGGLNRESVAWAFSNTDYVRRYFPLGWLGFDALIAVDGYNAALFHAASWLLTGVNAVLAFLIGHTLLAPSGAANSPRTEWQRSGVALIAALLWSLHPQRAETAGWISGLLYLGSTTCACVAVLLYLRSTQIDPIGNHRFASIAAALAYLASVLIYPVFLGLPVLLLWRAVIRKGRSHTAAAARSLASWWLAAGFAIGMNFFAQATTSGPFPGFTALESFGFLPRVIAAVKTYFFYLAHTVWPETTCVFLGRTDRLLEVGHAKPVLVVILPFIIGAFIWRKTRTRTVAYVTAAVVSMAPFLGTMDPWFIAADRYTILWLGVFACAAGEILISPARPIWKILQFTTAGIALVACSIFYRPALAPWENTTTLQARIDEVNAAHLEPVVNFARPAAAFWVMGQRAESARRLQAGLKAFPHSPRLLEAQRDLATSETHWRQRVGNRTSITPLALAHYDHGVTWKQRGYPASAAAHFKRAFQLAPEFSEAAAGLVATTAPPSDAGDLTPR